VRFSGPHPGGKSGKRCQEDRARSGPALLAWADRAGVRLAPELVGMILDGFGPRPDGEDRFDAVVGLFGMLNLALGLRPIAEPAGADLRQIEGWILGQSVLEG
jgi:hypothetical protein